MNVYMCIVPIRNENIQNCIMFFLFLFFSYWINEFMARKKNGRAMIVW